MENVKPIRLSEAIRLGATLREQEFGEYFTNGGSCALGAAAEAAGCKYGEVAGGFINEWLPLINVMDKLPCPQCGTVAIDRRYAMLPAHLNDDHRWTRERIADWVELNFEPLPQSEPISDVDRIGYVPEMAK